VGSEGQVAVGFAIGRSLREPQTDRSMKGVYCFRARNRLRRPGVAKGFVRCSVPLEGIASDDRIAYRASSRTSSSIPSIFSSVESKAKVSSEIRISRALTSMRFSPADRGFLLCLQERSLITSAI
jgi:hypothetical protein